MSYRGRKVTVVMPAYNAAATLEKTYRDLPRGMVDDVILVDDASADNTVEIAKRLGLYVKRHSKNMGYGGNQKTCYRTALSRGADVIVMVHPDHQYDPKVVPDLVRAMVDRGRLAVFGSRMLNRRNALAGGMPKWKFIFNIALTKIGNLFLGTSLTEFHSGFRAYDRRVFGMIDIGKNSDDFVFDTQIIIQLASRGIGIEEIPIRTRYFEESSQIRLLPALKYGAEIMFNLFLYKSGLREY